MTTATVVLDDGEEIEVRQLGIFELDFLDPDPLGPFTYQGETLAGVAEIEYDGSKWESPPSKPDVENPQKGSSEWYELREWELYHSWIRHENSRKQAAAEYHNKVADYILSTCISEDARLHILTGKDWAAVHRAALVPQLTQEDVAAALRDTFPGYI